MQFVTVLDNIKIVMTYLVLGNTDNTGIFIYIYIHTNTYIYTKF